MKYALRLVTTARAIDPEKPNRYRKLGTCATMYASSFCAFISLRRAARRSLADVI
ncbi:MAG: hypothetical protein NTX15_02000 [Candidatus Kapabacteria bacterium]|nr:hypothetical protein [Candidatus Kapabacteria bacterium]